MPRPDIRIMESNKHNQNNGIGSGFLLGVIVGVIVTLLFTTKKGREIFKEILEKGIDKFSNLEDLMRESYNADDVDEEFEDEDDFVPTEPIKELETPKVKKVIETKEEKPLARTSVARPATQNPPAPKPQVAKEPPKPVEPVEEELEPDITDPIPAEPEVKQKIEEKVEEKPKTKRWFRGLRK